MFRRVFFAVSLCALLLTLAMGSVASAADWRVAQASGRVYVKQGPVRLASLSRDVVLKNGAVVVTERNGRALLVRGEQTMIVAPNSMVTLPADNGTFTRIVEGMGQVEYNVDARQVRHFEVKTPYLAAVVKGTRFLVRVYRGGASVSVLRGRVEVTSLGTGETADVLPGQRAVVNEGEGLAINGAGAIQPIKQGKARGTQASPSRDERADNAKGGVSVGAGSATANAGTGGVSASVGGAAASVGGGGVSAGIGGVTASAGSGGVSVDAGVGGVSVGTNGGISASVGGLSVGIK